MYFIISVEDTTENVGLKPNIMFMNRPDQITLYTVQISESVPSSPVNHLFKIENRFGIA